MVNKDFAKDMADKMDSLLEKVKADAESRGIDTTGKTMAEIQKLLSDLGGTEQKH